MSTRKLAVTRKAYSDLRQTAKWLKAEYSDRTASRWQVAMWDAFDELLAIPDRYAAYEDVLIVDIELRERIVRRYRGIVYRIFYSFDDATVTIHRIRNASKDALTEDDF